MTRYNYIRVQIGDWSIPICNISSIFDQARDKLYTDTNCTHLSNDAPNVLQGREKNIVTCDFNEVIGTL